MNKRKKTTKKVAKVASAHAPVIGGVAGMALSGFLGGAMDGNIDTVFDTTGAFSGGVAGTMMGAIWKQNYKNNSAEKKAKQQQILLTSMNDIDSNSESDYETWEDENNSLVQYKKRLLKKEKNLEQRELVLKEIEMNAKFQEQEKN